MAAGNPISTLPPGIPAGAVPEMVTVGGTHGGSSGGTEVPGSYIYLNPTTGMYDRYNVDGTFDHSFPPGSGNLNSGLLGDTLGGIANTAAKEPIFAAGLAAVGGAALSGAGAGAGATGAGATGAGALGTGAADTAAYTGAGLTAGSGTTGLAAGGLTGLGAGSTIGSGVATDVAANTLAPSLGASGLMATGAGAAGAGAAGTAGASTLANSLIPGISNAGLLSTGLNLAGGIVNANAASDAAKTQADAQIRAAQIAADAAKFKPVGVTTGFGSSQFGYDANGNLTSAGYQLTPAMQAQRDALIGQSTGLLQQAGGAQAATAPMAQTAQTMMGLGQGYLATSPQEQAAKYYADQQAILAPQRAQDMAALQAQMQAQGRGGFAMGGDAGMGAANPQLQALLNAQQQQNTQLSANATQGGMDYANFGANMVGQGGNMLSGMYGVQNAAYSPYKTALGSAQTVEGLGQNAMTLGTSLGGQTSAANAAAGGLLAGGITNAAQTMAPSNAYSPWGALLSGAGSTMSGYKFDPMTGKAL